VQLQTLGIFVDNAGQSTVVLHYNMNRVTIIKVGFLISNSDRGHGRTNARGSAQLFHSCQEIWRGRPLVSVILICTGLRVCFLLRSVPRLVESCASEAGGMALFRGAICRAGDAIRLSLFNSRNCSHICSPLQWTGLLASKASAVLQRGLDCSAFKLSSSDRKSINSYRGF
jgi:hypothetical protein